MIESARALQWMRTTLLASAPLVAALGDGVAGVHRAYAPVGSRAPWVILGHQGGVDVMGVAGNRLMNKSLYQAKVVGPASNYQILVTIADLIDTALHDVKGTTTDGRILECVREQPLEMDEIVSGEVWASVGGLYRIYAQAGLL